MTQATPRALHAARLAAFRERFDGQVVLPADPGYESARAVWNGMIDRRPAIIARPASATAVVDALRFGRDEDLPIAVRSGGHSLPGHSTCDDGIVIDLSLMRGVTVDPQRRIARVNGGALLGELDDAAQAHGLACNSYVGDERDRDLAGFAALGPPVAGGMGPQTHLESQHANDAGLAWGHRQFSKSGFLGSIPDALVDAMVAHVAESPGDDVYSIWAQGGALGRIPDEATAFTGRSAPYWIGAETQWDDPALDDAHIGWSRRAIALTEPYRVVGSYVNDASDPSDDAQLRQIYGPAKLDRLVAVKRAWDPDNVFRLNQNIRP